MTGFAQWLDTTFEGFDRALLGMYHALAEAAGGFATPFLKLFSWAGEDGIFLIILSVILLLFKKTRKSGFAMLVALLIGDVLCNTVIKDMVQRARPFHHTEAVFYEWWQYVGAMEVGKYSFPSGHTTCAMAVMGALSITGDRKWLWFTIPFVVFTGMSRNYFMVHYPTDVLMGVIVGAVAAVLGVLLVDAFVKYILPKVKKA